MSSTTFNSIGGFNKLCILGDGDTCFVEEIADHKLFPPENMPSAKCKWYVSLKNKRNIEKKQIKYLKDTKLTHIYHGPVSNRKYAERNFVLYYIQEVMKNTYLDFIEFGPVVKWKNLENEFLWLMKEKEQIPYNEQQAFRMFDTVINENIIRVCSGGFKVLDIPFGSSFTKFSKFCGSNLKQQSKPNVIKINDLNYVQFETENNTANGQLDLWLNNGETKDLREYNSFYIQYKAQDQTPYFYSLVSEDGTTKERPLRNGFNDIRDFNGFYKHIRISFKNKLQISKLYFIKNKN